MNAKTQKALNTNNIPLGLDFHTLNSTTVELILNTAKGCGYRKPKNANGSTARYFYAYLNRVADKR